MADGTLGLIDLPTSGEDRSIRPQTRRAGEILVFRRHRHVNVRSRSWLRIVRSDTISRERYGGDKTRASERKYT